MSQAASKPCWVFVARAIGESGEVVISQTVSDLRWVVVAGAIGGSEARS